MCLPAEQRWVRRRKRGRRGDGWGSATLWLGTWSSLSLQLTGVIGFWASLHSLSIALSFFCFVLIRSPFSNFYTPPPDTHTHTQSFFLTVIHAAHLQCFQERQIKRGFSYRSVTLELRASWITINSIKQHSLCFAPSQAYHPGGLPLSLLNICVYLHNHTPNNLIPKCPAPPGKKKVNAHLQNVRAVSWFSMKRRKQCWSKLHVAASAETGF